MVHHDTLTIEALTYGPNALAHRSDGKAVFVSGGAPGDEVRVTYVQDKASFAVATVDEVVHASSARVSPPEELARISAAAPWAHIAYDEQLSAKRSNVVESLVRIGHVERATAEQLVEPCCASSETLRYRNKIELACSTDEHNRLVVGITPAEGEQVQPVSTFPLAHKAIEQAPKKLQGALRFLEGGEPGRLGIHRIGVRHSKRTGALEIALWTTPGAFPRKQVARTLADALPATSIVRVLAEPGRARAIKGVEALMGAGHWHEEVAGYSYRVSAPSFFQVNTKAADVLVRTAITGLGVKEGARVADLYCGVGTFTLPLAGLGCDVSAVESAGTAVRDLRRNAEENELFVDVIGGDSARELPDLGNLDALLVDPPRAGLAEGVAQSIAQAGPQKLAYISCDPATWARDIARLDVCGYTLERVVPVDLFPHTYHCELVSILYRR